MKKNWFLLAVLSTLFMVFAGCDKLPAPATDAEPTSGLTLELTSTGLNGEKYCVKGDIVVTGGPDDATFTFKNDSCGGESLTYAFKPGKYKVNIPVPDCSVTPANASYVGCELTEPNKPFDVRVANTTKVTIPVKFKFAEDDEVIVVFGVGAGEIDIDAGTTVTKYCGGIKEGEPCDDSSYCLDYGNKGKPKCYVVCDKGDDCKDDEFCKSVMIADGSGGEGGGRIAIPGICLEDGTSGSGGTGGNGSGGTTSTGGTSSGSGGTSPSGDCTMLSIRWDLPVEDYLASDVNVVSSITKWGSLCQQSNDTNRDDDVFQCTACVPPGRAQFDLSMLNDQSPTGVIWFGEENYEECGYEFGGDGDVQGILTLIANGEELPWRLVKNSTFCGPATASPCTDAACVTTKNPTGKKMLTYNAEVLIPAAL